MTSVSNERKRTGPQPVWLGKSSKVQLDGAEHHSESQERS